MDLDIAAEHRVYNLGNNNPVELKYFISLIEKAVDKKADIKYLPMQKGDVLKTAADISESTRDFNYKPKVSIEEGIEKIARWYLTTA